MARVFVITVAAARHVLAHSPLQDTDRPLAIARYASHGLDALGDVASTGGLNRVASFAPPSSPRGPNEERRQTKPHAIWDVEELGRWLAVALDDPFGGMWPLAATSGMRRSELAGVRREMLDLAGDSALKTRA